MSTTSDAHISRVDEFKHDLFKFNSALLKSFIRKHITTGPTVVLTDSDYYKLRDQVAQQFDVHPSAVVVVGSCRTGFSIKPTQRYHRVRDSSDIDIAIVSRDRFEDYWNLAFDYVRVNRLWKGSKEHKGLVSDLFNGWLWPRRFPPTSELKAAADWVNFEDRLGREWFEGRRSVGARIYRSWDRLEAYQTIHVSECLRALIRSK